MITVLFRAVVVGVLFSSIAAFAQEGEEQADPGRQKRFSFLTAQADKLKFEFTSGDKVALTRGKEPILRWSNPVRDFTSDGLVFIYFEGERPQVVMGLYIKGEPATADRGNLMREGTSLCGKPLTCRRDGTALWTPQSGALVDQELPNGPAFADRPTQRLAQMREIAARFEATAYDRSDTSSQLRLMPRPLARYEAKEAGVLDGALFSFAESNDPEVFLRLEAVAANDKQKPRWQYTLARMTSHRVNVKLDGTEVFSADRYYRTSRGPNDPYSEQTDEKVTITVEPSDVPADAK